MAPSKTKSFPAQIKYIIGNEAAERFSFYGMRSILVVFMIQHLGIETHVSKSIYHLFVSACYLLPLLGAIISDRFFGKYNTILYLSLFYCLGHGTLAFWENRTGLYIGLALIALGAGGIKPCISSFVGDQFNESNKELIKKVYDWFYFSVNFGSFFSTIMIPWILPHFGPSVAFGIPGVLMGIATLIFWLGRKHYVRVPPTGQTGEKGFIAVMGYGLFHWVKNLLSGKPIRNIFFYADKKFKASEVEGTRAAFDVFKLLITVSFFWALFDQHGSTWVLQGTKMDQVFMGSKIQPSQMQALNPIMVMVLIPIFSLGIYPWFEKRGIKVTPLRKMSAGMLLTGVSFLAAAIIQGLIDNGVNVNISWQFIQYLILTMSEVLISITGLEFAYTQAPRALKSTIMSFWLLTVFVGNFFTAIVSAINPFSGGAAEFLFYAVGMGVVSLIFIFSASRYKMRNYIEKAT